MNSLQVIPNENKPQVEGIQLLLGVEGEVDRAVIDTIKGIQKEVLKLAKMKYLGSLNTQASYSIQTDPNTIAFAVKYLGFDQPTVSGDKMRSMLMILANNKHSLKFIAFVHLTCPFEVQVV